MGKYQTYPEYKDSGVEWLGEIPASWSVVNIKHVTNIINGSTPKSGVAEYWDGSINWVTPSDLSQLDSKYIYDTQRKITELGLNSCGTTLIPTHSIILSTRAPIGSLAISGSQLCTNQGCKTLVPQDKSLSKFIYYYFSVLTGPLNNLGRGSTFLELSSDDLGSVKLPVPFEFLEDITSFLDHETVKIDNLIEKQQQLIELLKEKRQAVISHAVTKGLNPDVPMKDSGVEWLEEVPEHWNICLIKYKCKQITDGAHISPETNGGEHYFVSIKDINNGVIDFENTLLTTSNSYNYLVKTGCMPFEGDILFSKDGTIGQTAITPSNIEFVVASSLIIIRPDRMKVTPEFLDFLLQSALVKEQVESFVKGAALRRLSILNLLKVFAVFPPLEEQSIISNYINIRLEKFNELENQANTQVKLLQERRTALISAAVTGKIDVRNWIAPTNHNAAYTESQELTA